MHQVSTSRQDQLFSSQDAQQELEVEASNVEENDDNQVGSVAGGEVITKLIKEELISTYSTIEPEQNKEQSENFVDSVQVDVPASQKENVQVSSSEKSENTEENVSILEDNSEIKETHEKSEGEKSTLVENLDSVKCEETSESKETESTFFDLLNSGVARNEETTEEKVAVLEVSSGSGNSAKKVLQANANVANLVVKKPAVFGEEDSDDDSGSDNEEGVVYEWEVDYILDRKKVENVTYYKVKWKGYDEVFTTWEVIERIPHPEQFITNYEENLKKSPNVIAA